MSTITHPGLPRLWSEREELRDKGQFWTPEWVADAMVAYVAREANEVFDPGVGKGVFYISLKKLNGNVKFYGIDNDPEIIEEARRAGIFGKNSKIELRDFIWTPPQRLFKAIVSNPPYIRHHRLSPDIKNKFREISLRAMSVTLDGRAGLHIYFLIQALNSLDRNGRLAFIMPADTCEGVFSRKLWDWIIGRFCLDGVVTFDPRATPFPGVDTNAVIFLIRNAKQKKTIQWVKCLEPQSKELADFLRNDLIGDPGAGLSVQERDIAEAVATGLSRTPQDKYRFEYTLSHFARVMRGVATGSNEFFFLTTEKIKDLGIPGKFFLPAIGRTRDVEGNRITPRTLVELEKKGRPTLLFFPNGRAWESMPESVRNYISYGESVGLPNHALISTRRPWYKMEVRKAPEFLFAYLGRRNARFIKNEAGIVPLTGFLCIYPHSRDKGYVDRLWKLLQHPGTLSNLRLVGKSYGSGAIKVEPRSLERLPIEGKLVSEAGLEPLKSQFSLFD